MFTGVIENLGIIEEIRTQDSQKRILVQIPQVLKAKCGDSIAINGCCLTIAEMKENLLYFDILNITLETTNLCNLKKGDLVNLEQAMSADGRFNGHFIQGHIEALGEIYTLKKNEREYLLEILIPQNLSLYCVEKGSIAIDGISLTIAKITILPIGIKLQFGIISTTYQKTRLPQIQIGDKVNIETDILAKYAKQK